MEDNFLSNPFNVKEESGGKEDFSVFVGKLVYVVNNDGGFELIGGELVFLYESSVNAGDFCATINKCMDVDGFHCM